MVQDAVLRNLEIMGESVKKLPEVWKQSQPQVEWVKVGDFRNVLAHDYLEVGLDIVWNINYLLPIPYSLLPIPQVIQQALIMNSHISLY
jgi:uncharacterized protein with HEPN domain